MTARVDLPAPRMPTMTMDASASKGAAAGAAACSGGDGHPGWWYSSRRQAVRQPRRVYATGERTEGGRGEGRAYLWAPNQPTGAPPEQHQARAGRPGRCRRRTRLVGVSAAVPSASRATKQRPWRRTSASRPQRPASLPWWRVQRVQPESVDCRGDGGHLPSACCCGQRLAVRWAARNQKGPSHSSWAGVWWEGSKWRGLEWKACNVTSKPGKGGRNSIRCWVTLLGHLLCTVPG